MRLGDISELTVAFTLQVACFTNQHILERIKRLCARSNTFHALTIKQWEDIGHAAGNWIDPKLGDKYWNSFIAIKRRKNRFAPY